MHTRHMRHTRKAFTLLEMLVALGVFAIIGVLSSRILLGMVDVSAATADHAAELAALQRAVAVVERDVEQLVRRTVRDEYGDSRDAVAMDAEALLELTRYGWQNPLGAPRAELQRIAYVLRDEKLVRLFWPILDRAGDTEPIVQVLLYGVEDVDFLAHDDKDNDHRRWPLPPTDKNDEIYLAAIEMRLKHKAFGRIERLWLVPPSDEFLVGEDGSGKVDSPEDLLQDPAKEGGRKDS